VQEVYCFWVAMLAQYFSLFDEVADDAGIEHVTH
jgi:hypothetical protein